MEIMTLNGIVLNLNLRKFVPSLGTIISVYLEVLNL